MSVRGGSRRILMHGMALVLVGLVWGLAVPHTPYPRLALGAHIQFVSNGLLYVILATVLLSVPHAVGPRSILVMLLSAWLTWTMALSELANAWWGTRQTLPIAAGQAAAQGGRPWQEQIVLVTHIGAGVGLIVAWSLLIAGFVRHGAAARRSGEVS